MGSETALVLRKLAEDRLALVGLLIVVGLIACAVLAPWLATHPGPPGDTYALERDKSGRHGRIMKYNLNKS